MKFKLVVLFFTLWTFTGDISLGKDPRPMGLILGESTINDVVDTLKRRGAKEVFHDKAYSVIVDTRQGPVVVFVPKVISENFPLSRLVELPDVSSVVAYNIPNLGKDSFVFAFLVREKLFLMKYLVPLNKDNLNVILKILSTLQDRYEFDNLGRVGEQLKKNLEEGVKSSLAIEQFNLSGMLIATHGNVVVGITLVNENGKESLVLEYANIPLFARISNRAKKIYRETRSFESLF